MLLSTALQAAIEMDNVTQLLRYLFLGQKDCFMLSNWKEPTLVSIQIHLRFIQNMVLPGNEDLPLKFIKKAMVCKSLTRKQNCIIALAYCVRRVDNDKLREAVYKSLPQLLTTDEYLFQFIEYASMLNVHAAGTTSVTTDTAAAHAKGFGKGMRKAISQWYHQRSALTLANMFGRNRGLHKWSHKDLICMCHVKFLADDDRADVVKALFSRSNKTVESIESGDSQASLTPAMKIVYKISSLKVCEDPDDAARKIQSDMLQLEHAPSHFYNEPSFWLVLVPHLSFDQLLKNFLTLNDRNLLKVSDALSKKYSLLFGREALVKESSVQPLQLLYILNGYAAKKRYSEARKDYWYQKKVVERRGLVVNDFFVAKLKVAMNFSYQNIPVIGCQFIITLDLRPTNLKRHVFNMKHLRCIEAMAVLALGFVKRENNTKVYQFTRNKGQLKSIKMNANDNFQDVYQRLQSATIPKSSQSLATPIAQANDKHPKVFITIMDSVARVCRQGLPEFPEFETYRRKHKNAKYIVINLARHTHDLYGYDKKGLLEISGLAPDTLATIEAFCSGQFS